MSKNCGEFEWHRKDYRQYRVDAIRAAKDLGYGDAVVNKLKNAKSDREIADIMSAARKEKWG